MSKRKRRLTALELAGSEYLRVTVEYQLPDGGSRMSASWEVFGETTFDELCEAVRGALDEVSREVL